MKRDSKPLDKKSKISLKQATARPDWTSDTAPGPGGSAGTIHGNNGEHGVHGFQGTALNIDAGCIVGQRNMLSFDIQSGNGSNGQNGSNGKDSRDGEKAPDGTKLTWGGSRKHKCGTFTSVGFQTNTITATFE